ncbi:MAG: caspase family protein, partial [Pseudomonadota bacterium]
MPRWPVPPRSLRLGAIAAVMALASAVPAAAQVTSRLDALIRGSTALTPPSAVIDLTEPATKRYAIVIGNSDYASAIDLPNAVADARSMSTFLRAQGYDVRHHEDITKRGFEDVLRAAMFDIDKDTEVVLFFAGHGFQIGSENYLVPVDSNFDTVYDVPFETVSLGSLVSIIGARARLQVVILDSCRDNPFAGQVGLTQIGNELRETKTGFASLAAPLNSILIYSTSPGAVALDGEGTNSPFTAALLETAAENPGAPVKDIFEEVRRDVYQATGGFQVPWDSSTLIETVRFGGTQATADGAVSETAPTKTRGIALVSGLGALPEETATTDGPVEVVLEAPFQDEVAIGAPLIDALGLQPGTTVTVTRLPETADLILEEPGGVRLDALDREIGADAIDRLLLVGRSVQIPAIELPSAAVSDTMVIEASGQSYTIGLNFSVEACDFEAGDHLDPNGSGLVRYANEIAPERALAACEAAVAEEPEVGRFHYQLGRALTALRRFGEARSAFETARDLGHTRAWRALAGSVQTEILATGGTARGVEMPEEAQAYLAQGVAAGDPYAYYALGREFMRFGGSDSVEIEGYDLHA